MDSAGSLLSSEDLVVSGEIHVPRASDSDALHGEHVRLAEVGGNGLQLGGAGSEACRGGPGVAVVAADDGLEIKADTWRLIYRALLPGRPAWWPGADHQHTLANSL